MTRFEEDGLCYVWWNYLTLSRNSDYLLNTLSWKLSGWWLFRILLSAVNANLICKLSYLGQRLQKHWEGKERVLRKDVTSADKALMKLQSYRLLIVSDDREESGLWSDISLLGLHENWPLPVNSRTGPFIFTLIMESILLHPLAYIFLHFNINIFEEQEVCQHSMRSER